MWILASSIRRVARIWKRGGLFWKSEKCANDLNPNFHCSWISFTRFVWKLRRNFSESSEIQRFFPPKSGGLQKKKKRSSPKLRLIFWPKSEIQRFFRPKSGGLQKKKVFVKIEADFLAQIENPNVWGGLFSNGGAIFNFSQEIGLKTTKMVRFCILHKPMGGGSSPPAPLATLLFSIEGDPYCGTPKFCQILFFHIFACCSEKFHQSRVSGSVLNFGVLVWGRSLHFGTPKFCQIWSYLHFVYSENFLSPA